jgi:hypothetical protein
MIKKRPSLLGFQHIRGTKRTRYAFFYNGLPEKAGFLAGICTFFENEYRQSQLNLLIIMSVLSLSRFPITDESALLKIYGYST